MDASGSRGPHRSGSLKDMPTEVLVFDCLIPEDPSGDPQPCQASFAATGSWQGEEARVRVMDLGIAAHGLRAGGWAGEALDEVLSEGAAHVLVPASAEVLREGLMARGVALATGCVSIADYGVLTGGVALNGIEVRDEAAEVLNHPGLMQRTSNGAAMADAAVQRWMHLAQVAGPLVPRAYSVRWSGAGGRRTILGMMRRLDHHRACGRVPTVLLTGADLPGEVAADPSGLAQVAQAWADDAALRRDLDDLERRTHFSWLVSARGGDEGPALAATQAVLGSPSVWGPGFKRYAQARRPRVVVVPTWQCELRCRYCTIPKQGGQVMTPSVLDGALDLLLSADGEGHELQFFGGEPFLEWDLIQHAVEAGESMAPGRIQYRFTTNGWSLTPERLRWLAGHNVHFQLSLDGDRETQNSSRRPLERGADSYDHSPAVLVDVLKELGVAHDLIQVVHPSNATQADTNFQHLLDLGYRRIQLNYALGTRWTDEAKMDLAGALHRLGLDLRSRWEAGEEVDMVNLRETRMRVRTNREVTVDWDGTVMSSNGFLYVPKQRNNYILGHLDEGGSFDRYMMDGPADEQLLEWWYPEEITRNNQSVGAILMSFVRWMTSPEAAPLP